MSLLLVKLLVMVLGLSLPTTQAHGHHECLPPFEVLTENVCVTVHYSPLSWEDAEKECNSMGLDSYLAILVNDRVYKGVEKYLSNKDNVDNLWIGANDVSGEWRWINDIPMNTNSPRWLPNHPKPPTNPPTAMCAILQPDSTGRHYFVDIPCTSKAQGAVCFRDYHQHH